MLREFEIMVNAAAVEPLSDALLAAGALSVSVRDADADSDIEEPLFGEPGFEPARNAWRENRLAVLIDSTMDPADLVACAAVGILDPSPRIASIRTIADEDWVRLTQAQFAPTRIGTRLWVVPSWHAPPEEASVVVRLDPGVAFGTGTHPTTRLMLEWLDAHPPSGLRVLDYGCGSGILAIAAAKLGAAHVVGTDIDEQALAAARANAAANLAPGDYTAPDLLPPGAFDLVLANILTNPLKLLAPLLLERVAQRGWLVLSGVLERQAEEVRAAYAQNDAQVPLSVWRAAEGWVCLSGTRG
ncbi:MAG TPA: 50S ribosomal protein L11 methyltransferase [Burkholderiaceae bacterium]|nr:50S ribosomal protein L11 methyltransferase [Burkholderiaceae bacterium]